MITKNFPLPSEEELSVEEINLGTPSLRAGSFHLGKYCEHPSKVRLCLNNSSGVCTRYPYVFNSLYLSSLV